MGKISKEAKENYANAIYQNAMVGVQSIRDIIDKVESNDLRQELNREEELFNEVAEDVKIFAKRSKIEVKENNLFEKTRLWASINMSTMFDKSTRHITELMLLGTVMGLITCYKDKCDHEGVSNELDEILLKLEKIEDENYQARQYSLKVLTYHSQTYLR